MTEPGPCIWCNDGVDSIKVESKPFLGRTLWRVMCVSYPCQRITHKAFGWTREDAVARYNRRREKVMKRREKEMERRWK